MLLRSRSVAALRSAFVLLGLPLAALQGCTSAPADEAAQSQSDALLPGPGGGLGGPGGSCPPGYTMQCASYHNGACVTFKCMPGKAPPPPPPPCGLLGGACCPPAPSSGSSVGTCSARYATCVSDKCVTCGGPGEIPCTGIYSCFDGTPVNGLCLACSSVKNANVAMTATGPTTATVSFTSTAAFSTDVSFVNTKDLADRHEFFGPTSTTSTVLATGLSPSTQYYVVLTPEGCGSLPITQSKNGMFDSSNFALARAASGLDQSSVTLKPGPNGPQAVFVPSAALLALKPSLGTQPLAFTLPSPTFSPPSPLPDYTATFTALHASMADVTVNFNVDGVEFILPFTATLHLHTSGVTPDADLNIDSGTIDVKVGFSSLTQTFVLNSVTADIHDHVSNCGIGGWCNGIFNANLPNLDQLVQQAIQPILSTAVSDPSVTTAVEQVFAQVLNLTQGPGVPWSIAPGSMYYTTSFNDSQFDFTLQWIANSTGLVTTK